MISNLKMPPLVHFSMLLVNNNRSKCYLQNLIQAGYLPDLILVLDAQNTVLPEHTENDTIHPDEASQTFIQTCKECEISFDEKEHVLATGKKHKIHAELLPTLDVNDPRVVQTVLKAPGSYMIYSGPGGTILRKELLNTGKKFLHVHPGWLPEYRGSTTIYYALLSGGAIGCSVIAFDEHIDQGPVFYRTRFELTAKQDLDHVFDPGIRTRALLDFFKLNWGKSPKPIAVPETSEPEVFYIIHPVLKHLAILSTKGVVKP